MSFSITVFARPLILLSASLIVRAAAPSDISLTSISSDSNADGRAEVLAIGTDGNLYHRWQITDGWSFWTQLGAGKFSDAKLLLSADQRLYAFGIDNGQLVIFAQASTNGGWASQPYRTGDGLQKLSVTHDNSGYFVVAALKDGALWTMTGVGDQTLDSRGWSDWGLLGGDHLKSLSAARDGDGRVVIATLDGGSQLQAVRQVSSNDSRWTKWQSLGAGKDGDLAMAVSPERALWLFNTGQKQGLFARKLAATTPEQARRKPVDKIVIGQPAPANRKTTVVTPSTVVSQVKQMGLDLLPLNDAWSRPVPLIDQPLFPIEGIAAQPSASGTLDLFAAGTRFAVENNGADANRVTLFTGRQDGWPGSSQVLPGSQKVSIFSRLAASHGTRSDALFALDRGTGRVFVLARSGNAKWSDGMWVRLGRVPGPTFPDLAFQAVVCLDSIGTPGKAASLRGQISTGVTVNLKGVLAGTAVGDLVNDVNALSICTPHGESLGVWLDGESNPDALMQSSFIPSGNAFAILLPEATLRRAVDDIWNTIPKHQTFDGKAVRASDQDVELTSHDFALESPDTLVLSIFGRAPAYSLNIKGEVRAHLFTQNGIAGCTASVSADVDPWWLRKLIEGIATGFFMALPDNYLNGVFSDVGKSQAAQICTVSTAFVSDLYLPLPQEKSLPAQILQVRYSGLQVQKGVGLIGFGQDLPTLRDRKPKVTLSFTPLLAGKDRIRVKFEVKTADMKMPGMVKWLPSDPQAATRILQPTDLNRDTTHDTMSVFEYEVPSSNIARWYRLGAMTSEVAGVDGIVIANTQSVDVFMRPR